MSELIVKNNRVVSRVELLVTVSAAALMASVCASNAAEGDADRPTVWIEMGGQLERIDTAQNLFAPSFFALAKPSILAPMVDAQHPPAYGLATEGKISFEPEGSNWVFSAAVRYGRANGGKHLHHEQSVVSATQVFASPLRSSIGDGLTTYHDTNLTVDFQAGKDVGLGMFGSGGSSIVSAGVRIAQFTSESNIKLQAKPYIHNSSNAYVPGKYNFRNRHMISYTAVLSANRDTQAMGPSLSWDASAMLTRNGEHATLDFDWGMNASVLFGRQRVRMHQRTSAYHFNIVPFHTPYGTYGAHSTQSANPERSRSVTIPNIGGFAGISLKFPNAKVALGYRADFFFNAMDSGIDTHKSSTLGFYGPFATISVGLGG
jgi:hypothetical protein